jgi:hypothetical protein
MNNDPGRCIRVRGARAHDLQDVDIRRDALVVFTGARPAPSTARARRAADARPSPDRTHA